MAKKIIKNRLIDTQTMPWHEIKILKFNDLKSVEGREIGKLKESILRFGFIAPFFLYKDYVLDGSGRNIALEMLEYEGHAIDDLPVAHIDAKNMVEAKEMVLAISSSYGDVTEESWLAFTGDMPDLDTSFMELANFSPDGLLSELPVIEKKSKKKITVEVECPECGHSFIK
jgi:hypothetical protein